MGVIVRKVFVSYARANRPHVEQLVEHLGVLDCQTWFDSSLRGGQDWWEQILDRITDCDVFIAIISREALNSVACQREFDWAEALGKPVLPVALQPPSQALPLRFSRRQIVDYSDQANRDRAALVLAGGLNALTAAPALPEPLPDVPAPPLSYLTDLVEVVSAKDPLDHDQQRQILFQLEAALRSTDPEERRGGRDVLEQFSSRSDLYADVDRMIGGLKQLTDSAAAASPDDHGIGQASAAAPSGPQAPREGQEAPAEPRVERDGDTVTQGKPVSRPAPVGGEQLLQPIQSAPDAAASVTESDQHRVPTAESIHQPTVPAQASAAPALATGTDAVSRRGTPAPTEDHHTESALPTDTGLVSAKPLLQRLRGRTKLAIIAGAVAVVATVVLLVVFMSGGTASQTAGSAPQTAGSASQTAGSASQTVLPFTGLNEPVGVAVDAVGDLYVTDGVNNRVLKLAGGSSTQSVLPFTGLGGPWGVVVDSAGDVYVTDANNSRVLKLAAGSSTQTALPFTGLNQPFGVAVDTAGTLYVADWRNNRVVKLAAGSSTQTALPFTGLNEPVGVAVDSAGTLYVADTGNNRVLKLPAGSSSQSVLPFTGLGPPDGVAVDSAGDVYVTDANNSRVLKLAAGSSTQSVLPFTGLSYPYGAAVDSAGTLYVADKDNNQVVKLAAG
jgi:streptogramin lyase